MSLRTKELYKDKGQRTKAKVKSSKDTCRSQGKSKNNPTQISFIRVNRVRCKQEQGLTDRQSSSINPFIDRLATVFFVSMHSSYKPSSCTALISLEEDPARIAYGPFSRIHACLPSSQYLSSETGILKTSS